MGDVQGDAGEIRRLRRAAISHISPIYLPHISLHVPCISPTSPLHLPYISPISPLYLTCIMKDELLSPGWTRALSTTPLRDLSAWEI